MTSALTSLFQEVLTFLLPLGSHLYYFTATLAGVGTSFLSAMTVSSLLDLERDYEKEKEKKWERKGEWRRDKLVCR